MPVSLRCAANTSSSSPSSGPSSCAPTACTTSRPSTSHTAACLCLCSVLPCGHAGADPNQSALPRRLDLPPLWLRRPPRGRLGGDGGGSRRGGTTDVPRVVGQARADVGSPLIQSAPQRSILERRRKLLLRFGYLSPLAKLAETAPRLTSSDARFCRVGQRALRRPHRGRGARAVAAGRVGRHGPARALPRAARPGPAARVYPRLLENRAHAAPR